MAENGNSGIGDYQELLEAILHEIRQYRSFVETRMEPILVSIRDTLTSRLPTPPPVPAPTPAAVASVARPASGIEDRRADLTIFLMVSAIQMYASYLLNLHMQIAVRARVAYTLLAVLGVLVLVDKISPIMSSFIHYMELLLLLELNYYVLIMSASYSDVHNTSYIAIQMYTTHHTFSTCTVRARWIALQPDLCISKTSHNLHTKTRYYGFSNTRIPTTSNRRAALTNSSPLESRTAAPTSP